MRDTPEQAAPLDAVEAAWTRRTPLPAWTPADLDRWLAPFPGLGARSWTPLAGGLRSLNLRGEPLPPGWPRLADLLDLFNLVGLVDGAEGRRREDVVARIDATLDRG